METTLTDVELDLIGHALGINVYHARLSKKKSDKKLPKEFYRNYYCATTSSDNYDVLVNLRTRDLMISQDKYDQVYFHVTDEGIELFKSEFNLIISTCSR